MTIAFDIRQMGFAIELLMTLGKLPKLFVLFLNNKIFKNHVFPLLLRDIMK